MAFYLKSTAYTRLFKLIASSDHLSKLTGATATVNICKAGGTFGAAAGTVTEVANGWYKVALTTADTGTAGDLAFYITATSADDTDFVDQVLDPATANLGVNLVNIAGSAVSTSTAQLGVNAVNLGGTAQTGRDLGASVLLAAGQKVDVDTIKTNPVVNAGTVTFPTGATLASTTNITAGTITTVTNLTNAPTSGDLTATMKTSVTTAASAATPVATVSGDFSPTMKTSLNAATPASVTGAVGSVTGNVGGNVTGSVGSVVGAVGSVTGAVGSVTGAVGSVTGAVGSVTGNVGGSVASVTAAVAITSSIKKNQALSKFQFLMTDSTNHNPATGKTVTCTRSIDGGAFGAGALANVTEVSNGTYTVDFAAGDLNGNVIVLRATASSCDDTFERVVTQP